MTLSEVRLFHTAGHISQSFKGGNLAQQVIQIENYLGSVHLFNM